MRMLSKLAKKGKNYNHLEGERPSEAFLNLENVKKGYNEVILLNKNNPNYNTSKARSKENSRLVPPSIPKDIQEAGS